MASTSTPTSLSAAHKAALKIGEHLAQTTNENSLFTRGLVSLKLGHSWDNQWTLCPSDLESVVRVAREALFGVSPDLPGSVDVILAPTVDYVAEQSGAGSDEDEDLEPVSFVAMNTEVTHPFWSSYEPSLQPGQDWLLLAGHMQRIHLELTSRLFAGEDPRPAFMRLAAMKPALAAVTSALMRQNGRPIRLHQGLLVMQNWSSDSAEAMEQIRAFFAEHSPLEVTVAQDPNDPDTYVIDVVGGDSVEVPRTSYLALAHQGTEIRVLDESEFRQLEAY